MGSGGTPLTFVHLFMRHLLFRVMKFRNDIRWKRLEAFVKIWLFAACLFTLGAAPATDEMQKTGRVWFLIEDDSRLYLAGTSNVNKFTCHCEDRYEQQVLEYHQSSGYLRFGKLQLNMRTNHFDCHNRKIDADLQKALRADEYPHIRVAFTDAGIEQKCLEKNCTGWFPVKINTEVTITNVTKKVFMEAEARLVGPGGLQLRGQKSLNMSQFGVSPPEAMFGMIKVNDLITFHFDLKIQITLQ